MTDQSAIGNSFRRAVLSGERRKLVVTDKSPRLEHSGDALDASIVPRAEIRRADHRGGDRHRLQEETATAYYRRRAHVVELINLSSGGAMIRARFDPQLWDMIELDFGDGPRVECAVRWLKEDLVGLEFAHETRIECDPEERARLLLDVIQRSFPDVAVELEAPEGPVEMAPATAEKREEQLGNRAEARHPMVWSGQILFSFDSSPVRLRNISTGGALVDVEMIYPVGAEVVLDLSEAGQFDAVVTRMNGDQAGLKFKQPFDLACLAKLRPDLTPYRWTRPEFLNQKEEEDSSPWAEEWGRSSLSDLRSELEGYLKH